MEADWFGRARLRNHGQFWLIKAEWMTVSDPANGFWDSSTNH